MLTAIFVHADGTHEPREVEPDREVWCVPQYQDRDGSWLRAGQRRRSHIEYSALDLDVPTCQVAYRKVYFHRTLVRYPPTWSGPIEQGALWRFEPVIVYDEHPPILSASVGPQQWPRQEIWRFEIRYIEDGA